MGNGMLGSTEEYDTYLRWVRSRPYRVELAALIMSTAPLSSDYQLASRIVTALDTTPLHTSG